MCIRDRDYTLRGAIELGDIYWNEFDTIGPAFLDVYELESKVAKQSRVIVGPVLLDCLCNRMFDDWMEWPSSHLFARSEDNLIRLGLPRMRESKAATIAHVEGLMEAAGKNADRYCELLAELQSEFPHRATIAELRQGPNSVVAAKRLHQRN